jgi:thiol:disulfide interchange protein
MSSPRSFSPLWGLLLLPLGLLAGHFIGRLPVAARPDTAPAHATPVATPVPGDAPLAAPAAPSSEASAGADAGGPVRWLPIQDAVDRSRQSGKPVLFDFNAEWCGPCQSLKAEVFESSIHARAIEAVVLPVSVVDQVREQGSNPPDLEALQQRFNIEGFPTLVVLNARNGKMVKSAGYMGEAQTVEWIEKAAESVR